jgi:hypothetical protein
MPKDFYTKHLYDVDLIGIYQSIDPELNKHSLSSIQKQEIKESFLLSSQTYCEVKGIDFNVHFSETTYIVVPSEEPFYEFAISRMLLFYDINKINLFLNYQHAHYYKGDDFIGLIEFVVYGIVSKQTLFNNELRLEKIMQWVENTRIKKGKSKPIPTIDKKEDSLVWNSEKECLTNLSVRLKLKGYTKGKNDFAKVFTHQQHISWLEKPDFLAHLLYTLYKGKVFKTSKGKGCFAIAESYFSYYSDKSDKKLPLKTISSRVNKDAIKYSSTRKEVKKTIEDCIK